MLCHPRHNGVGVFRPVLDSSSSCPAEALPLPLEPFNRISPYVHLVVWSWVSRVLLCWSQEVMLLGRTWAAFICMNAPAVATPTEVSCTAFGCLSHTERPSPLLFYTYKMSCGVKADILLLTPPTYTPQNIEMPRLSTWRITIILPLSFCASICLQPLFLRPFQVCVCGRPRCPLNGLLNSRSRISPHGVTSLCL